jgi:hypothetical protein
MRTRPWTTATARPSPSALRHPPVRHVPNDVAIGIAEKRDKTRHDATPEPTTRAVSRTICTSRPHPAAGIPADVESCNSDCRPALKAEPHARSRSSARRVTAPDTHPRVFTQTRPNATSETTRPAPPLGHLPPVKSRIPSRLRVFADHFSVSPWCAVRAGFPAHKPGTIIRNLPAEDPANA